MDIEERAAIEASEAAELEAETATAEVAEAERERLELEALLAELNKEVPLLRLSFIHYA